MNNAFKQFFGRFLSHDDEEAQAKSADFKTESGFYPSDSYYDPQARLKQRLRLMFPHLPTGGLPPSHDIDEDEHF